MNKIEKLELIINEAYKNYEKNAVVGDVIDSHYEPATDKWHLYNKEEFINNIKKDERFANKWVSNEVPKFRVGDKAWKPKGYKFPCTIVSVFTTVNGETRVVAEMDDYGLLHIFNEQQLEHYE